MSTLNDEKKDRIKCAKLLRVAACPGATKAERATARSMANRILERRGWSRASVSRFDPNHPGQSSFHLDTNGEMTTIQKLTASFLADLVPGLRVNASALPPRFRVEFAVDLPREAKPIFGVWKNLAQAINQIYHGQSIMEAELCEPSLNELWFVRGLLQGLAQNIRVAHAKAAKAEKKRFRKAKRNPLAVMICRKPVPVSVELGGKGAGDSLVTPTPLGHTPTRQPAEGLASAETHADTPSQASPQPAGDPRSFSLGWRAGMLINPSEMMSEIL